MAGGRLQAGEVRTAKLQNDRRIEIVHFPPEADRCLENTVPFVVVTDPTTMTPENSQTVKLHRVLKSTPDRVYRAFLDADAKAKWLPPNGFTGKVHHLDAKVGGTYRMSFTNFTTGSEHHFGGTFVELVPNERIVQVDRFEDPALPGEMTVTIELKEVFCGTQLEITQAGIPAAIPAEACYLGWQESLVLLAKLVEAEIPDDC